MRLILQVILRVLRDFVSFVLNPVIRNLSRIGELKSPGGATGLFDSERIQKGRVRATAPDSVPYSPTS